LLRSLRDPVATEEAVSQILSRLDSLSAKFEVINTVGHREGRGHKLLSEPAAAAFEEAWRAEVRASPATVLAKEPDLFRVLLATKREAGPSEPGVEVDAAPPVTLAVLRGARGEVRTQSVTSRTVRHSPRLAWDALIELYGNEPTLRE